MSHILNNHILCCHAATEQWNHRTCTASAPLLGSFRWLCSMDLTRIVQNIAEPSRGLLRPFVMISYQFSVDFKNLVTYSLDGKLSKSGCRNHQFLQNIAYFIWCHDLTKSICSKIADVQKHPNVTLLRPRAKCDTALNGLPNEFRWSPGVAMSLVLGLLK